MTINGQCQLPKDSAIVYPYTYPPAIPAHIAVLNIDNHIVLSSDGARVRIAGVARTTTPASAHPDIKRANHNIQKFPDIPVKNQAPDQTIMLTDINVYGCHHWDR